MSKKKDDYDNIIAESIDKLNVDHDFSGTSIDKKQLKKGQKQFRFSHPLIFTVTFIAIVSVLANIYFGKKSQAIRVQQEVLAEQLIAEIANTHGDFDSADESIKDRKREEITRLVEKLQEFAKQNSANANPVSRENLLSELRGHFRGLNLDEKILDNVEAIKEQ